MNDPVTSKIIAAAYKVFNTLGFGFFEKIYENSMIIELPKHEVFAVQQMPLSVYYEEQVVGDFAMDLVVNKQIIVELKSVRRLLEEHEVQLVNYLTATKLDVGLLINFGPNGVEVKRKYRLYRPKGGDEQD